MASGLSQQSRPDAWGTQGLVHRLHTYGQAACVHAQVGRGRNPHWHFQVVCDSSGLPVHTPVCLRPALRGKQYRLVWTREDLGRAPRGQQAVTTRTLSPKQ